MPNLLFCLGRAVADVGVAELVAAVADPNLVNAAGVLAKVAANAWKEWRADKKQDKLNADILAAANSASRTPRSRRPKSPHRCPPTPRCKGTSSGS